jgi:hypothetical protein
MNGAGMPEAELLLQHGCQFRVTGIQKGLVDLELVNNIGDVTKGGRTFEVWNDDSRFGWAEPPLSKLAMILKRSGHA